MTQYMLGLTSGVSHGTAFSQVLTQTSPAAGAGFTYTNDGRYWERLVSVSFRMVTNGNAANRQVTLAVNDGLGVQLAAFPSASVQTASLTWDYTFLPNVDTFNTVVGLNVLSPLFAGFLQPLYSVAVTVGAMDAADQISRIRIYVERFVTGDAGYLLGPVEVDDREALEAIRVGRVLD